MIMMAPITMMVLIKIPIMKIKATATLMIIIIIKVMVVALKLLYALDSLCIYLFMNISGLLDSRLVDFITW